MKTDLKLCSICPCQTAASSKGDVAALAQEGTAEVPAELIHAIGAVRMIVMVMVMMIMVVMIVVVMIMIVVAITMFEVTRDSLKTSRDLFDRAALVGVSRAAPVRRCEGWGRVGIGLCYF